MSSRTVRRLLTLAALTLLSATLALAQESSQPAAQAIDWDSAGRLLPKNHKVFVATIADPTRRHACHVQAFEPNRLLCSRHAGRKPVIYQRTDVATLIAPGVHAAVLPWFLGLAAAGGGTIYGAIVLASVSVVAAVPVAIVGGILLLMAPLTGMLSDDDWPETVLYLAPGQHLQVNLHN